ncbi:hypothetical protein [Streptomyces sp. NPDC013489]|uniref:hypothetical protein n=1 Tax=Streptomyces sp. NPDC013489 TaxID=3155606 RepID=UPI0033F6CEFD
MAENAAMDSWALRCPPAIDCSQKASRTALVASVVRQDDRTRTVLDETGLTRIRVYVQRHLTDPGLRPARQPIAHHFPRTPRQTPRRRAHD